VTLLKTIDDACDFIGDWCREKRSYPGQPLSADFAVPDCIVRLNARLGGLWPGAKRQPGPIVEYPRRFLGLLSQQDEIINPSKYARDENGFVAFINENQHVWQFGFDPDNADQLLVRGDCTFGPRGAAGFEWDLAEARTEDALVFTLLINLSMYGPEAEWDGDAPKPEAAHLALWQHPAWQSSHFDGFWINDERTLIYYSGWQVTRR
jgi:hypothetical protein